jgi:hypothetical protein
MGIIENNKMIAEFMGLKQGRPDEPVRWKHDWFDDEGVINGHRNTHLLFHESWSWLMPVVDKIESIEDENRQAKYNVDILQCFVTIIENDTSEEIVDIDRDNKMTAVYEAVLEFIKWYNKQKQ